MRSAFSLSACELLSEYFYNLNDELTGACRAPTGAVAKGDGGHAESSFAKVDTRCLGTLRLELHRRLVTERRV